MLAMLNMSWLGEKGVSLEKGKIGQQRVDFFSFK